ncbi:MAG: HypC/HybG/HupF family hydrogenase formation chaperone [Lachnospiraceae bacterium]|nr:HypC/HybG/HupF family hydrogenase formation chaperone [Lachnospiraceae bacterium]
MCIASSGVIIEKKGHKATVDFGGNIVEAEAGLTACEVGDHVLVHAGCIIQTLTESEAEEMDEIMGLINGMEEIK